MTKKLIIKPQRLLKIVGRKVGKDTLILQIIKEEKNKYVWWGYYTQHVWECVSDWASPGVVVSCLCLWLGFVGTGLEPVKVRKLLPVVVLVLIRVVMVGAHDVISGLGLRLLRTWGSETADEEFTMTQWRCFSKLVNDWSNWLTTQFHCDITQGDQKCSYRSKSKGLPKRLLLIQVAQRICFRDDSTCFQR